MLWKPASYVKTCDKPRRPVYHNTTSIPDDWVIAGVKDVPMVTMRYGYKDLEERTKAEVVEVIRSMNDEGKFVSKVWVCEKLNFKERKGDEIFTALKREGKIEEFFAIRDGRKLGYYWRIAGVKAKRSMQKIHASMRRTLRGDFKGRFNSPYVGSLETSDPSSKQTSSFREELEKQGFEILKRESLRHRAQMRNYEDGRPGDGREGTQYTQQGCLIRVTDPDNPESVLISKLLEVSRDKELTPAAARSAARRLDSKVITPDLVELMCKILTDKKEKFAVTFLELIRNFDEILREHATFIRMQEVDTFKEHVREMTAGTELIFMRENMRLATKYCFGFLNLSIDSKTVNSAWKESMEDCLNPGAATSFTGYSTELKPAVYPSEEAFNSREALIEDYEHLLNKVKSSEFIPLAYKLVICALTGKVKESTLAKLIKDTEEPLYKEMAADRALFEYLYASPVSKFVDWQSFFEFRKNYVSAFRALLEANHMRHPALERYYEYITSDGGINDTFIENHRILENKEREEIDATRRYHTTGSFTSV